MTTTQNLTEIRNRLARMTDAELWIASDDADDEYDARINADGDDNGHRTEAFRPVMDALHAEMAARGLLD